QLYSMRYATLPIVNGTGGLKDSVKDMAEDDGTGFVLPQLSPEKIVDAVERATSFYTAKDQLHDARLRAMAYDSTWEKSALQYEGVYSDLLEQCSN
ncbi:MAG: glycogen synthase, partial [Candidatus Ornithospirochaeta sp.]